MDYISIVKREVHDKPYFNTMLWHIFILQSFSLKKSVCIIDIRVV